MDIQAAAISAILKEHIANFGTAAAVDAAVGRRSMVVGDSEGLQHVLLADAAFPTDEFENHDFSIAAQGALFAIRPHTADFGEPDPPGVPTPDIALLDVT